MQQNVFQLTGIDQVIPVHGVEGAKSYPIGPNCRVPLFDDAEDVFYIKKTDANGFPEIKRYRFEEEVLIDSTSSGTGVSLQDIRSIIREEIGSIKEEILNVQQQISSLSAHLDTCCCEIKTQMLQDKLDEANAKIVAQQNEISNAQQTQTILNTLGRFVAWAGSGSQATSVNTVG